MKTILLPLFILLTVINLSAQFLDVQWVTSEYDSYYWQLDKDLNSIQASSFVDSILVDNTTFVSEGEHDILLQKRNSNGDRIWATTMSSLNDEKITAMDTNSKNEFCIMGTFDTVLELTINTNDLPYPALSPNVLANFVAVYNEDTSLKYAVVLQTNGDTLQKDAILLTDDSEVIISGTYIDQLTLEIFNTDPYIHANPGEHSYAIKLDPDGNFDWWNFDDLFIESFSLSRYLSYDHDQLILSYSSFQTASVAKLDFGNGEILWDNILGAKPYGHQSDEFGNVYVVGGFDMDLQLDWDPGLDELFLESNASDIFLMKYDQDGNLLWVKNVVSGNLIDTGTSLTLTDNGEVILTGCIQSSADFDPSSDTYELNASGAEDVFVASYDLDGNFLWADKFGGNSYDIGFQIKSIEDSLWIYGIYNKEVDFDLTDEVFTIESQNDGDNASYFMVKYINCEMEDCLSNTIEEFDVSSKIYPNPTKDYLHIRGSDMTKELIIYNLEGKLVLQNFNPIKNQSLDVSHLSNGVYFLRIKSNDKLTTKKFIKS